MELTEKYWVYALGFFAQALFGTRLLVQLFHTERKGKVVSPTIFWQISLIASFLFLTYGIIRNDFVIILGQTINYFIYIRNLQLKNDWRKIPLALRIILTSLPFIAFAYTFLGNTESLNTLLAKNDLTDPVIVIGSIGQLLLNFRFIYQWYYSEKHRTSILPLGFWIISTIASLMIIRYAVYVTDHKSIDPVLLVAQSMGIVVYLRNVFIHFKSGVSSRTVS
jgi:lipid-A-disaccharide synthase-like uncharacterized protein